MALPNDGMTRSCSGGIPVPGNVSYNGYMATRELLQAVERPESQQLLTLPLPEFYLL